MAFALALYEALIRAMRNYRSEGEVLHWWPRVGISIPRGPLSSGARGLADPTRRGCYCPETILTFCFSRGEMVVTYALSGDGAIMLLAMSHMVVVLVAGAAGFYLMHVFAR